MTTSVSRLLLISCPVHGCGTWIRTALTDPWTAEQRCPGCGAHFTLPVCDVPPSGETLAPISLLHLPTFDREYVQVRLEESFRITLVGRLDLFSADVLARVWAGLPSPRRAVFDLSGATELSDKGVAALLGLCAAVEEGSRAVILLRAGDAEQQRAFAGSPLIHSENNAALLALGGVPEASRRLPAVTIRREEIAAPASKPPKGGMQGSASQDETKSVSPPHRRRLEVEEIGDVTVVTFVDRKLLDKQNVEIVGEELFRLVDEGGRRKILLNFGNVEYLSSTMNGKLITLHKKMQNIHGRLVFCNIDPQIYEVFEITKLNKFFYILRDEQTALLAF
jgi:anti-sigma B factor antagonist